MFGLTCDQLLVVEVVDLHGAFHVGERFGGDFAGRFRDYAQTYRLPEGE